MPRRHKAAKSACVHCGALERALEEIHKIICAKPGGAMAKIKEICGRHGVVCDHRERPSLE